MLWRDIKINKKYAAWIKNSEQCIFNVLEGGVRSGKTTSLILAFCRALERLPFDSVNIAAAESIALARTILGEGGSELGIKNYFGENAREGQYKGKDALFIKLGKNNHIVVFAGSRNSDAYKSIRGLTATLAILTEANLAHRTFIEEIIARTLSADPKYRRIFFDLNPTIDTHFIYEDFIDRWVEEHRKGIMLGGVNYDSVSLYENPSLKEEQAEQIASQYDKESNFYKALILGMRVNIVDTVYTLYSYNLIPSIIKPISYIIVVDIGVSASATTFLAMGKLSDNRIIVFDDYYHKNGSGSVGSGVKEYEDYANDLVEFYKKQTEIIGFPPRFVFIDKDISMLRILTRKFQENNIPNTKLNYVIKEKIEDRIIQTRNKLYLGEIVIVETLEHTKKGISNAVYDQKEKDKGKLVREDNSTLLFNPIDIVDPLEYGISYFIKYKY